jgi:hypothetical protein
MRTSQATPRGHHVKPAAKKSPKLSAIAGVKPRDLVGPTTILHDDHASHIF